MKRITLIAVLLMVLGGLKAQVNELYVSSTGWAQWDLFDCHLFHVQVDDQEEFELTLPYFQHDVSGFIEGTTHTTRVAPVVNGEVGYFSTVQWVYSSCEHNPGFVGEASAEWVGDDIVLQWHLPAEASSGDYFFEGFEDGIPSDWAIIDADGDDHVWYLASVLMAPPSFSFFPHSGDDMICSESFSNMVGVGALHPDNYLVTSKKHIVTGSVFSFWACAQDASWPAEHFGVGVSTGSQTNPADFTMLQEWTLTSKGERAHGTWYHYSVDLSAYDGQDVYIALRHFNCTDNFYINVDDMELSSPTRDIVGTLIVRDGTPMYAAYYAAETYTDVAPEPVDHEYTLYVVYNGIESDYSLWAMSCPVDVFVGEPTSVSERTAAPFSVYPNPTNGTFTLEGDGTATIYNALGQTVRELTVEGTTQVDLPRGMYLVRMGDTATKIVVK